jgi:hypothetical protein
MSLNESIVEDTFLEWFEELVPQTREVGHGLQERVRGRFLTGDVLLHHHSRDA